MSSGARWTIAVAAVLAALIAGLTVELRRDTPPPATSSLPAEPGHPEPGTGAALAGPRQRADLDPCAVAPGGNGPAALRGIVAECAADGRPVDVARMLAGRRVVLNLWAYWCVPCRAELPALADYQRQVGSDVLVVTVHQDVNEAAALALLADLGVRLPTLQDAGRRIAAALHVPNVMPATVVLAADGTVSRILPQAFTSAAEIAAAVDPPGR